MENQDRRAHPRQQGFLQVLVLDPEDALSAPYPGWVLDYSQGGVCLEAKGLDLEEGVLVRLQPALAQPTARYWVDVCVRNRRPGDDRKRFGCQFLAQSAWDWLLPVG